MVAGTVTAAGTSQAADRPTPALKPAAVQPVQDGATITAAKEAARAAKDANGKAHLVVRLKDKPLASYTGGVSGLAATSPRATGAKNLDVRSTASVATWPTSTAGSAPTRPG